jgi:nucleoid-associated protein YgaU
VKGNKEITMQEKTPPPWGTPPEAAPAEATPEQPETVPADSAYTQWYEVKKGDTLSKIAEQFYGDPKLYTTIFDANKDILTNPDLIQIGQKLRIP